MVNQLLFNSDLISQTVVMYEKFVLGMDVDPTQEYVDLEYAMKRAENVDYVATATRNQKTTAVARTSKRASRMVQQLRTSLQSQDTREGTFGMTEAWDDTANMRDQAMQQLVRECEHAVDRICMHEYGLRTRQIVGISMLPNDFGVRHPELMEYFNTKGRYGDNDDISDQRRSLLDQVTNSNIARNENLLSQTTVWQGSVYEHPQYFDKKATEKESRFDFKLGMGKKGKMMRR
eukprot:TRINITY_DN14884_c0_g2_i1.p1 TRINITY_DN14884_c0_g2~~TRINITY_DN14884_c0_g2_i1.p1  ORF type:complete len:259 (+),score=70.84 TRINITY_DN14884_c0_g2_i1:81-779(+)